MAITGNSVTAVPPTDSELSTTSTHPIQNKEVAETIGGISNLTTATKTSIVGAINEHDGEIGDLTSLTTTEDNTLVGAINELDSDVGDLSDLDTTDKDSVVDAINEVKETCEKTSGVKVSISLSSTWSGSGPYTQTVTVYGYTVTAKTIVDLMTDTSIVEQLKPYGVEQIYVSNDNTTLTAYAIGGKPSTSVTVNAILSEVL